MSVTSLIEYRSREAVVMLEHLLGRAKNGEIIGLAVCAKPTHGPEEIAFAGLYRSNPAKACNASMRMSWRLTQLQDEIDAAQI
jgi:hypothetical protein